MKKILSLLFCVVLVAAAMFAGCSAPAAESSPDEQTQDSAASWQENGYGEETESYEPGEAADGEIRDTNPSGEQKLVYTGEIWISTEQFSEDYEKIRSLVKEAGGYLAYESVEGKEPIEVYDSGRTAQFELMVPVEQYESVFATLGQIGTTEEKVSHAEDVSDQYYDTEARITLLETRYAKLEEMMKQAQKMEDMLTIEDAMSEILYELDSLKGNQRGMDERIQYAFISVFLDEDVKPGEVVVSEKDVGTRAADAFQSGMNSLGVAMENFVVGFAAAAPALIILVIVVAIVLAVLLPILHHKKKKRQQAAKAEEKTE